MFAPLTSAATRSSGAGVYLPDSKAPFASKITARMLMQHVSGLPRTEDEVFSRSVRVRPGTRARVGIDVLRHPGKVIFPNACQIGSGDRNDTKEL